MNKSVSVFCSSSEKLSDFFYHEVKILGYKLAEAKIDVWYGGAKSGLMGHLANSVIEKNGIVKGTIPKPGVIKETPHENLANLIIAESYLERKEILFEKADGYIIFPGGLGTLDEFLGVLLNKYIGLKFKPIVLVNYMGFWKTFLDFLEELVQQKMVSPSVFDMILLAENSIEAVKLVKDNLTD